MDNPELHNDLERLHTELQAVQSLDNKDREMLHKLAEDIQKVLGQEGSETERYQGLVDRLREAITQIEASHPRTTMLMRQVIDQLSFMGI